MEQERVPLLRYYSAMITPILTYACPAWFPLTDKQCRDSLESVQKRVLKIIAPEHDSYAQRLNSLALETVEGMLQKKTMEHYDKIMETLGHVLYDRVELTHHRRRSGRNKNSHLLLIKSRTEKRKYRFFLSNKVQ